MAMAIQIEVFAVVDSSGDYATGTSAEQAMERYGEDIGGDITEMDGFRTVKLLVTVPLPETVTLSGIVAEDAESTLTAV